MDTTINFWRKESSLRIHHEKKKGNQTNLYAQVASFVPSKNVVSYTLKNVLL